MKNFSIFNFFDQQRPHLETPTDLQVHSAAHDVDIFELTDDGNDSESRFVQPQYRSSKLDLTMSTTEVSIQVERTNASHISVASAI